MSALTAVARIVADGALGGWIGMMAFFSFVGATRAFEVYERAVAGRYVNSVFPTYYGIGIGLGVVGVAAALVVGAGTAFSLALWVGIVATALATLDQAYARWVLVPKMAAAGDDAFGRYHGQSVALNGVALLLVAIAFVAVHL